MLVTRYAFCIMTLLLAVETLAEAQIAISAVEAFRSGGTPPPPLNPTLVPRPLEPEQVIVDLIEKALRSAPMNPVKRCVLAVIEAAPAADWVPYTDIVKAVESIVGVPDASYRARAALRDLSQQMREVPVAHVQGEKFIEILAARKRAGGIILYRLTMAGRAAVRWCLQNVSAIN